MMGALVKQMKPSAPGSEQRDQVLERLEVAVKILYMMVTFVKVTPLYTIL